MSYFNRLVQDQAIEAAAEAFAVRSEYERQRRELEALRDIDGVLGLDDEHIEELAWLDPVHFRDKAHEVRTHYARSTGPRFNRAMGVDGRDAVADTKRAVAIATDRKTSFSEALAEVRRGV
jgi:hypothetical protein